MLSAEFGGLIVHKGGTESGLSYAGLLVKATRRASVEVAGFRGGAEV